MNSSKHSVKREYSMGFGILLATIIIVICMINALVLGNAYVHHKKKALMSAYEIMNSYAEDNLLKTEEFETEMNRIASLNNMEIVILDSNLSEVASTFTESEMSTERMMNYIFRGAPNTKVIYEDSKYQIQRVNDNKMGFEYIELWGLMANDNFVSIRTSVESIKESSAVATQLLITIGCICLLVGFFLVIYTANTFTKPIQRLVKISERMTQLDFDARYEGNGGNEIDILGEHINQLSSALEKTITDLKTANIELQKDIDTKIADEERRKELISNISHELKTPIALVQGYAEGLKDCVNDDAESRDFYCDVIIDEASRMNKLVGNLLELDQIENGLNKMVMEHFDVIELIYNCVAKMDIFIKQDDIQVIMPERKPLYVWFDEFKAEQIFNNYLSNAIHYAKYDKVIKITADTVGSKLRIKVFNTGDPIPEESIELLWNKFYKVDKARTREYGGSGIGLSIVKAIMEYSGNSYGVTNYDNGVEFWFDLDIVKSLDEI